MTLLSPPLACRHSRKRTSEPQAAEEGASDPQLVRALEVLKSWTYFDRLREGGKPTTMHALSTDEEATAATP